jgi:large subunit ribosomal protein L4
MNVKVLNASGDSSGEIALDDAIFGAKVNVPLMHQVVTAQLAAARAGTHSTKTRGEVRGGGAKPWRQKGTGRARHGSTREPQWKGGGVAFGPKTRDHSMSVPKKMKALALRSALSDRAREGNVLVVDGLTFEKPKTKDAVSSLKAWGAEGKVLLVLTLDDITVAYAFRNLQHVHVIAEQQLNVYDVLNADRVVFMKSALDALQARVGGGTGQPEAPTPAPTPAPTEIQEPETTPNPAAPEPAAENPTDESESS